MRYLLVGLCLAALVFAFVYVYKTKNPDLHAANFGGVSLRLEYATTTTARERGLGGRTSLEADHGMLFVFSEPNRYGFWMKDTLIPLDIFWLDDKGRVVWMEQGVTPATYPTVFYPSVPAWYVLETVSGFAKLHGIATGTPLVLQSWP